MINVILVLILALELLALYKIFLRKYSDFQEKKIFPINAAQQLTSMPKRLKESVGTYYGKIPYLKIAIGTFFTTIAVRAIAIFSLKNLITNYADVIFKPLIYFCILVPVVFLFFLMGCRIAKKIVVSIEGIEIFLMFFKNPLFIPQNCIIDMSRTFTEEGGNHIYTFFLNGNKLNKLVFVSDNILLPEALFDPLIDCK